MCTNIKKNSKIENRIYCSPQNYFKFHFISWTDLLFKKSLVLLAGVLSYSWNDLILFCTRVEDINCAELATKTPEGGFFSKATTTIALWADQCAQWSITSSCILYNLLQVLCQTPAAGNLTSLTSDSLFTLTYTMSIKRNISSPGTAWFSWIIFFFFRSQFWVQFPFCNYMNWSSQRQ